ncbi:hypothetical protein M9H77_35491 [Catharanthus roseus]|nr:hypothetical protein M9H77_35491 [Catharanthus roseus]
MKDLNFHAATLSEEESLRELKAFDETKAGVKGIVDTGITKIPRIFIDQPKNLDRISVCRGKSDIKIPVINLNGLSSNSEIRREIVEKIGEASEKYGFFQIVNHGIPQDVMDKMVDGVRKFHEQDDQIKRQYYSRDRFNKNFLYSSNYVLIPGIACNWRDTMECIMNSNQPDPQEFPDVCRDILMKYSNYVRNLGLILFELLSEALGLKPNHLEEMDCAEGLILLGHYYPACPQPELTFGTSKHSDSGFLTILMQDQIGGLQILLENQWIDVPFIPGALVINIADLLQLITNDKFKSVEHRVLANKVGPRISVAVAFGIKTQTQEGVSPRLYGPIKELISEENPPIYKEVTVKDFITIRFAKRFDDSSSLSPFRLNN